jgi:hypothetical protein
VPNRHLTTLLTAKCHCYTPALRASVPPREDVLEQKPGSRTNYRWSLRRGRSWGPRRALCALRRGPYFAFPPAPMVPAAACGSRTPRLPATARARVSARACLRRHQDVLMAAKFVAETSTACAYGWSDAGPRAGTMQASAPIRSAVGAACTSTVGRIDVIYYLVGVKPPDGRDFSIPRLRASTEVGAAASFPPTSKMLRTVLGHRRELRHDPRRSLCTLPR